jgi:hypothetical protein
LVAGLAILLGFQLAVFGVFTKLFAVREGLHPPSAHLKCFAHYFGLETGACVGVLVALSGLFLLDYATWSGASTLLVASIPAFR